MSKHLREFSASERKVGQAHAKAFTEFFKGRRGATPDSGSLEAEAEVAAAQAASESALLSLPNVVGVGPAYKIKGGKPVNTFALTVFVEKKLEKGALSKGEVVPPEIDGVVTDVVEVGRVDALAFTAKQRPALPGFSIGHHAITAGTFGCVVENLRPREAGSRGEYLMLSNNHVFADVNKATAGDLILQPGPFDGGQYPSDGVATLERFEPIILSQFPNPTGYNLVDAAVARPLDSRFVTPSILGLAMPTGISQAAVGTPVLKVGRTTQLTGGVVLSVNATIAVGYGASGIGAFHHQIITTAMAAGGDSGSLLMDRELRAVGLLFAGSAVITIFNHIADVEVALGVRPLTSTR
ncbi:MAG: hypothetical protein U0Q12_06765 [Vicinamibacterales bacterium]